MKDNLEDLLKQLYEQKEVPSQEFCQSVIQNMKERERDRTGFLWKKEKVSYQGILMAVICAGIVILTGIGIQVYRQGGFPGKGISWKQDVAEHDNPTPAATEDPGDIGNREEAKNPIDEGKQTETKDSVETEKPFDEKNKVETTPMPDDGQEHRQESSGGNAGNSQKEEGVFGGLSGSGNRKPQITKTAEPTRTSKPRETSKPTRTSKPMLPSETILPQKIPGSQENYVAVCSIETHVFSSTLQIPAGEEVDGPASVFDSRFILSYEQLQSLIGEIEEKLVQIPDHDLQNILLQLRGYDPSYFASNALCIHWSYMKAGMDVGLRAVWVRDMGQGNYYLDIWLDKVYDETAQASGVKFYSSFVSVPQTIARSCNMVQFHF